MTEVGIRAKALAKLGMVSGAWAVLSTDQGQEAPAAHRRLVIIHGIMRSIKHHHDLISSSSI